MKDFIHNDFLLENKWASRLYHDYAAEMPVIDYHNHLVPKDIAKNRHFTDISEIWLGGDHYKWRAMRSNGVSEEMITGPVPSRERFRAWARTVPATLRNPLYHWTHLELARYFGIKEKLLGPDTADEIYDRCNEILSGEDYRTWNLLEKMDVEVLCTTDDPADSLEYHAALRKERNVSFRMVPGWRPDRALKGEDPGIFNDWIERLEVAADMEIRTVDDFRQALERRHDFFHRQGCRISDYGLETLVAEEFTGEEISSAFLELRNGRPLRGEVLDKFRSAMMQFLAGLDARSNWTMQLHMGVMRNNNSRMYQMLGPDAGFDSIGDFNHARPLVKFLDSLDRMGTLPRTILYPVNPADNEMIATMIGNFQNGSVPGKMQFGPAWWFLDNLKGLEIQLDVLSAMGLLSRFVGMTTDSRSVLSFTRHEYFRRILCNLLGCEMEKGLLPSDIDLLGSLVRDISYNNAKAYFNFTD